MKNVSYSKKKVEKCAGMTAAFKNIEKSKTERKFK